MLNLHLHTHHNVPWEAVKYSNAIGSRMPLENAVENDTWRKRREGGDGSISNDTQQMPDSRGSKETSA